MKEEKYEKDLANMMEEKTIESARKSKGKKKGKGKGKPSVEEIEIEISAKKGIPSKAELLKKLRKKGPK